jgi:L-iditol 2-dehydrogenase/galactitol-1-phosphate 5-dehydrogenase
MKALQLIANGKLEYRDLPAPGRQKKEEVLLRVAFSGICGSDIHRAYHDGAYHYPLVMGHEFTGVVEEADEASRFSSGQRVVPFPLLPCYRCHSCQIGAYAQCQDYSYIGSRQDGGFAEYVVVPEANLYPVPDHVELMHASMTEPCAVALHGVNKLHIKPGDSAAVIGGGPIGNMVAQWLCIRGCRPVFVADIDQAKLKLAAGMDFVPVNSSRNDPVAQILKQSGGGVQKVVEACGLPATFRQALQVAAPFGEVVFLGNISGQFKVNEAEFSSILRRELVIYGTWNSKIVPRGQDEWTAVLKYMDRELTVAPLISHTPDLSQGPEIFQALTDGRLPGYRKVVFRVS